MDITEQIKVLNDYLEGLLIDQTENKVCNPSIIDYQIVPYGNSMVQLDVTLGVLVKSLIESDKSI